MKEFTEDDPEYTNEFVSRDSAAKLLPKQDENISILSSAESDLQRAEGKLRDAIEKLKDIQIASGVGGAVLGLLKMV